MAVYVLKDARLEVNSVNLSSYTREVELSVETNLEDQTTMGSNTERVIAGLKNWSVTATLAQDFASGAVDATLWSIYQAGTPVTIKLRPTTAAISATNPEYSGPAVLESYSPISGGVGDFAEVQVTFRAAGDLARATS